MTPLPNRFPERLEYPETNISVPVREVSRIHELLYVPLALIVRVVLFAITMVPSMKEGALIALIDENDDTIMSVEPSRDRTRELVEETILPDKKVTPPIVKSQF